MRETDWVAWHEPYDIPESPLARRLEAVQAHLRRTLDGCGEGPIGLVSACAGQGRDVIGALAHHPRCGDVSARLVEREGENCAYARRAAEEAGLDGVEVVAGDATVAGVYVPVAPAEVVVFCGVLGNVVEVEIPDLIARLPALCRPGATVTWTRHRRPPDASPMIRDAFAASGFTEVGWDAPPDAFFVVGSHRYDGEPVPLDPGQKLFTFLADATQRWQQP